MSTLERAIAIAAEAHAGQTDKAGESYILHPLRVMLSLQTEAERIVGILHDVIEDTPWTFEQLRAEGFSEEVLVALETVTKREGEEYEAFVQRSAQNRIGRRVKLVDLRDNSDISRIPSPTAKDYARLEKYQRAIATLEANDFIYHTADAATKAQVRQMWGNLQADHMEIDNGFSLVCLHNELLAGLISIEWRQLPSPLPHTAEAFIQIIEVAPTYRRQGIGRTLVSLAETQASKQGACQIRAWSSSDKLEAIPMWQALGYGLHPTTVQVHGKAVPGFYVTKSLSSRSELT